MQDLLKKTRFAPIVVSYFYCVEQFAVVCALRHTQGLMDLRRQDGIFIRNSLTKDI